MYQRLFEWVVNRINRVMEPRDRDPRRDGKDTVIGVLDIYGFEVFPVNRWVVSATTSHTLTPPPQLLVLGSSAGQRNRMPSVHHGWSLAPRLMSSSLLQLCQCPLVPGMARPWLTSLHRDSPIHFRVRVLGGLGGSNQVKEQPRVGDAPLLRGHLGCLVPDPSDNLQGIYLGGTLLFIGLPWWLRW